MFNTETSAATTTALPFTTESHPQLFGNGGPLTTERYQDLVTKSELCGNVLFLSCQGLSLTRDTGFRGTISQLSRTHLCASKRLHETDSQHSCPCDECSQFTLVLEKLNNLDTDASLIPGSKPTLSSAMSDIISEINMIYKGEANDIALKLNDAVAFNHKLSSWALANDTRNQMFERYLELTRSLESEKSLKQWLGQGKTQLVNRCSEVASWSPCMALQNHTQSSRVLKMVKDLRFATAMDEKEKRGKAYYASVPVFQSHQSLDNILMAAVTAAEVLVTLTPRLLI